MIYGLSVLSQMVSGRCFCGNGIHSRWERERERERERRQSFLNLVNAKQSIWIEALYLYKYISQISVISCSKRHQKQNYSANPADHQYGRRAGVQASAGARLSTAAGTRVRPQPPPGRSASGRGGREPVCRRRRSTLIRCPSPRNSSTVE